MPDFLAGIGIVVILFNYYRVSLSEHVSFTVLGPVIALCVLVFGAGGVIYGMTNIAKEKSLRSWSFRRAQCRQLPHYCDSPSKFKYI